MTFPPSLLGGRSPQEFLERYWQKRPLLVRGAFPERHCPVTPQELRSLAGDARVESRLILERGGAYPWEMRHGPFSVEELAALPERHWSLLVHEVNRHVPAVDDLLGAFRFVPNWRIDDVMVSQAPADSGVGAHVDQYDVFLVQGRGRRRWEIDAGDPAGHDLVPDLDVTILERFVPQQAWILEPGDLLYLPPGFGHRGVALDPSTTLSVGFRAPGVARLAASYLTHVLETHDPGQRLTDPDLQVQDNPGRVDTRALDAVAGALAGVLLDRAALANWFCRQVTEPVRETGVTARVPPLSPDDLRQILERGDALRRSSPAHFAYVDTEPACTELFVGGRAFRLSGALEAAAPLLCGVRRLDASSLGPHLEHPEWIELVLRLVNDGYLLPDGPGSRGAGAS